MKLTKEEKEKIPIEAVRNFIIAANSEDEVIDKYFELDQKHQRLEKQYQADFKHFAINQLSEIAILMQNQGYIINTLGDLENAIDLELQNIARDRNALKSYITMKGLNIAEDVSFGGL